jgi:hypothetical protein
MLKFIAKTIRNTHTFAYLQGAWEHRNGDGGRTHPSDPNWNEAYDRGMNLSERILPNGV